MVATVGLLGECWLQLVGCGGIDLDSPSGEYHNDCQTVVTAAPRKDFYGTGSLCTAVRDCVHFIQHFEGEGP